jgi:hypothetical protein
LDAALRTDSENTPLLSKLNHLAELTAKVGITAGLLLFAGFMIRFIVQVAKNDPPRYVSLFHPQSWECSLTTIASIASEKGIAFVNILIFAASLMSVVAVPEGWCSRIGRYHGADDILGLPFQVCPWLSRSHLRLQPSA